MTHSTNRVGIIAGTGELPSHIAHALHSSGKRIFVAGSNESDPSVMNNPHWESVRLDFHRLQDLLDALRKADVSEVVLAGKVEHRGIFRSDMFDERMLRFLEELKDSRGATILSAVVRVLEQEGYIVPSLLEVAPGLVPSGGLLAGPEPEPWQIRDLKFGWPLARRIANLDIGQTIIVKGGSVVAVEAMEGTDEAILRGLNIAKDGFTVIKVAAKNHDFRFDVPTIGQRTIEALADTNKCSLAFEAGRCFVLHREKIIPFCEKEGITLLSGSEDSDGEFFWPIK